MGVRTAQSGYTLVEVVIASALFVGVLMIATTTFATASRLRERTRTQQQVTDTARFVAETLARDIRSATGSTTGTAACGAFAVCPFEILSGGNPVNRPDSFGGFSTGTGLRTNRFDATADGGVLTRVYEFQPAADGFGDLVVYKGGEPAVSLLPTGFRVKDVVFRGLSHATPNLASQPFVQFEFSVIHAQSGVTQLIRSAVTSRELN